MSVEEIAKLIRDCSLSDDVAKLGLELQGMTHERLILSVAIAALSVAGKEKPLSKDNDEGLLYYSNENAALKAEIEHLKIQLADERSGACDDSLAKHLRRELGAAQEDRVRLKRKIEVAFKALAEARLDINWMLNNQRFLTDGVFGYLDKAIAEIEGTE